MTHAGRTTRKAIVLLLLGGTFAHAQMEHLLAPEVRVPILARNEAAALDRVVQRLRIDSERFTLTSEAVVAGIQRELTNRFGVEGELRLSLVRPWTAVALPADDFQLTLTEVPAEGLSSSFMVRAKVVSAGEVVGEWPLAVRAQLFQEMWAATGRIERGRALEGGMVIRQGVDVLRDRQALLPAHLDPASFEVTQAVTAPRLLLRRDVSERPLVRKGQMVEVVAKRGLLAISLKALALEAGPAGAVIKLRNLESRKEFSGEIINEDRVQIHF